MSTSVILFEPRRVPGSPASPLAGVSMARLAAAAVTASARGFGGTLPDQRRLHLVHGKSATAGQILAALAPQPAGWPGTPKTTPTPEGDHVQSR